MNVEYKHVKVRPHSYNHWVVLLKLRPEDIPRVGTDFYLRIDGKVYKEPSKELEQLVMWEKLRD